MHNLVIICTVKLWQIGRNCCQNRPTDQQTKVSPTSKPVETECLPSVQNQTPGMVTSIFSEIILLGRGKEFIHDTYN
jgi:hypothetical protein